MERVTGIGGVFVVAQDPVALQAWYAEHLGLGGADGDPEWQQEAGPTAFAAFAPGQAGAPVGPRGFGLNLRVRDLDAMVAQLRSAGVEVEVDPEPYPYGRFASLRDPEGGAVQLWQPAP